MTDLLPGDVGPHEAVQRVIRADHAGEYASARVYRGLLAVLGNRPQADALRRRLQQGDHRAAAMAAMVARRRVRPTAMLPLWHVAGFALGAVTAAMGDRCAAACASAVEEAIDEHHAVHDAALDDAELRGTIGQFRAAEAEPHTDAADDPGSGYAIMGRVIKLGCQLAFTVSGRI